MNFENLDNTKSILLMLRDMGAKNIDVNSSEIEIYPPEAGGATSGKSMLLSQTLYPMLILQKIQLKCWILEEDIPPAWLI